MTYDSLKLAVGLDFFERNHRQAFIKNPFICDQVVLLMNGAVKRTYEDVAQAYLIDA